MDTREEAHPLEPKPPRSWVRLTHSRYSRGTESRGLLAGSASRLCSAPAQSIRIVCSAMPFENMFPILPNFQVKLSSETC